MYTLVKKQKGGRNGIGAGLPLSFFCYFNHDLVAGEQNPVSVGNGGGKHISGPVHAQGLQRVTITFLHWCLHSLSTVPGSVALYQFGNVS